MGFIDRREIGKLASDPHPLARSDPVPADSPGKPVRARHGALRMPAATSIELAQVGEYAMHCRIQVYSQLGDALA
jgi:hypothetical protein